MSRSLPLVLLSSAFLTALSAHAQSTSYERPKVGLFCSPIHALQEPSGQPGGLWATGSNFKVSFHDGMCFYPLLGDGYPHNLPLAWRTTRVTVGESNLLANGERPKPASTDWRMEYRYDRLTEAYDVLEHGIEQSFVIHERPAAHGDLVIHGALSTKLRAPDTEPAHRPLVFTDEKGTPILDYGVAFAIDALGHRIDLETSLASGEVSIRVPQAWLESATFPVTVDPLLSSITLTPTNSDAAQSGCVVVEPIAHEIIAIVTRAFSASDHDIYGINYLPQWNLPITVFVNSSTTSSEHNPEIAFVGGINRWVTVFERHVAGGNPKYKIGYHQRGVADYALSGTIYDLSQFSDTARRNPDVGGTKVGSTGSLCAIVYEQEANNTGVNTTGTAVRREIRDLAVDNSLSVFQLATPGFDFERTAINAESDGGSSPWILTYQEFNSLNPTGSWQLRLTRYYPSGLSQAGGAIGVPSLLVHNINAKIAGRNGRYLVTYSQLASDGTHSTAFSGPTLRAAHFTWPDAAPGKTLREDWAFVNAAIPLVNVDIAFDTTTRGHWAAISHAAGSIFGARSVAVHRLTDNVRVEDHSINDGSQYHTGFGVCYDAEVGNFPIYYGGGSNGSPGTNTFGTFLEHPTASTPTVFGVGCGPGSITWSGTPISGSHDFEVELGSSGTPGLSPAALLVSRATGSVALDFAGLTGCFANVDLGPTFLAVVPTTATPSGSSARIAIPGTFVNTLAFQWAYSSPGLNPGGFGFTEGMLVTVVQ